MRIIYRRIRLFNNLQWYFEMGCEKSCFALSRFTLGGENSSFAFGCLVSEKVLRVCSCGQEQRLCLWFNPSSALCALRQEQETHLPIPSSQLKPRECSSRICQIQANISFAYIPISFGLIILYFSFTERK